MTEVLVFRHSEEEAAGHLGEACAAAGVTLCVVDWFAGEEPGAPIETAHGLVILGGAMSVHDEAEHPWLRTEKRLIRRAVEAGVPTLGICLGAQLIAQVMGAAVARNPEPEIGWYPLRLHPAASEDPLLCHLAEGEVLFQWHEDTFELPAGARLLAGSECCPRQAYRLGEHAWGLQFHMEATAELIARWLADAETRRAVDGAVGPGQAEAILAAVPRYMPRQAQVARAAFGAWAELVRERAEGRR